MILKDNLEDINSIECLIIEYQTGYNPIHFDESFFFIFPILSYIQPIKQNKIKEYSIILISKVVL